MSNFFKKSKRISEKNIYKIIKKSFDKDYYIKTHNYSNTDLEPLEHFIKEGWKNGLSPCSWFSIEAYLEANPDVARNGVNPFYHYLKYGVNEGRLLRLDNSKLVSNHEVNLEKLVGGSTIEKSLSIRASRCYKKVNKLLHADTFSIKKWKKWIKTFKMVDKHRAIRALIETAMSSEPSKMAEILFSVDSPMADLPERFTKFDLPIIQEIIKNKQQALKTMTETVYQFGEVHDPEVSVVIPLYGRIDFIEGQFVEFYKDEFIKNKCQLIYVVDDPSLVEPLKKLCENLFQLYQIPFMVVWGGANRGFSGANNLGVKHANAEHLLFMNSDVFPHKPGWLEQLKSALLENENLGVIAPRLLFADGSIQHAGINFMFRADLNVWINHHPNMGLSPELDPNKALTILPAVTGACILISRLDFDEIGGWDTGYLTGDFEDSDLCLKLRESGKDCGYLPTVELTHLERQSFQLNGSRDFREKVWMLNAVRHQNRWSSLFDHAAS